MKLKEVLMASDISVEMLGFVLTSMIKYGWSREEIIQYVNDSLDLKFEESMSNRTK